MQGSSTGTGWPELILQFVSRMDPQLGCALELMLMAAVLLFAPRPAHKRLQERRLPAETFSGERALSSGGC